MKKLWLVLLVALLLTGCSGKQSMETITDSFDVPTVSVMKKLEVELPSQFSAPVMESQTAGKLYICDEYWVTVHTVAAGDLAQTVYSITGMKKDDLDILKTRQGEVKRYQWVWTSAGEEGVQVGRACVLDDGAYHYIVTAQASEAVAGDLQEQWQAIFASVSIAP